jgi:hypothetical protein
MDGVTCCPLTSGDESAEYSTYSAKVVRCRTHKTCGECGTRIERGQRYELVKGKWFGEWCTYKTCMMCVEIRTHFACNGWVFGQLWEDLEENFFPDMKAGGPCMDGLSPTAKQHLIDERMRWYFDQGEVDPVSDEKWEGWKERRPSHG